MRNSYGLGSSGWKMVLYVLLELRRIQRLGILGVDRPASGPFDYSAESLERSARYSLGETQ